MEERFYDDILVVLILTLITIICLLIPWSNISSPLIYIPYILLLMFLPGYSLLAASISEFEHYSLIKRVILSVLLSLVSSIFIAALLTYTPLKILNGVILYFIGGLTVVLSLVAIMKRKSYHYVRFIEPVGEPVPAVPYIYVDQEQPLLKVESIENQDEEELSEDVEELDSDKPELDNPTPKKLVNEPKKINKDEIKKINKDEKKKINKNEMKSESEPTKQSEHRPSRSTYWDLIIVLILTIICTVVILNPGLNRTIFDGVTVNSIVGIFLMLFLPGYALTSTISPGKTDLNILTRLALSFGLSYFLTAVVGLILPYTPLGSSLEPILQILSGLTFIFIITAFLMRMRTPQGESFEAGPGKSDSKAKSTPSGSPTTTPKVSHLKRNITMVFGVVLIAILIAVPTAFNLMSPEENVTSTEFYVMAQDGNKLTTYPANLTPGENATVTIVLVNHEKEVTNYRIVITSNQTVIGELNTTLKPGEKKEIPYTFTMGDPGIKNIEFFLYKLPNINDVYKAYSFLISIYEQVNETTDSETSTNTDNGGSQPYVPPYQPPAPTPQPEPEPVPEPEPIFDNFII